MFFVSHFVSLLCILVYLDLISATCSISKYEDGSRNLLKCHNVSLSAALNEGNNSVAGIMLFQSQITSIPSNSFFKFAKSLESLNMHNCGIRDVNIHSNAFFGLTRLKKLGLSNNNITQVKEEWFSDLNSLLQLDLSFNLISSIDPSVFKRLSGLQRLDLTENQLICLDPNTMEPMSALDKFRFAGNPLILTCRGKLTLWLRDRGVNYKADQQREQYESWLDELLWMCAMEHEEIGRSEILMKECVLLNMFNQLRTGLVTGESFPWQTIQKCSRDREVLTKCLATNEHGDESKDLTNGRFVRKLLLALDWTKSTV